MTRALQLLHPAPLASVGEALHSNGSKHDNAPAGVPCFTLPPPSQWFGRPASASQFAQTSAQVPSALDAASNSTCSAGAYGGHYPPARQQPHNQHQLPAPVASTTLLRPAAPLSYEPAATDFYTNAPGGMSAAAAVQQCLMSMRALEPDMRTSEGGTAPFFSLLNAVLPLLGHMAAAQHHAVQQLLSFRPSRLFGTLYRRGDRHSGHGPRGVDGKEQVPEGTSCALIARGPRPPRHAQRLYEQARALERAHDPLAAAHAFLAAVEADPRQAEWLTLAAKQWTDAMYVPSTSTNQARSYHRRAIELCEQAMQMEPNAAHSYIGRCVSRGRLALLSDNRTKVQLAAEAQLDAQRALELEPQHDYAHHLMGRWHYEMAGLNAIARTLVRFLFGASLMHGSYAQAMEHYRQATLLAPRTLVHRVEYGRCLQMLGRPVEAISELQEALTKGEVDDLNGQLTKLDGEQLLEQLLSSPAGRAVALGTLSLPPPLAAAMPASEPAPLGVHSNK